MKKQASLRRKLLSWLVPLLLLLILVDSTILYRLAIGKLEKELDADLFISTKNIAQFLTNFGNSPKDIHLLENAGKIFLKDDVDEVLYSISDNQDHLLSGNKVLQQAASLSLANEKQAKADHYYYFTMIANESFRVVHAVFDVRNTQGTQTFTIQIASTQKWRKTLSNTILIGLVVPQLLLALLSFFIIWYGVKKGLAPLDALRTRFKPN
jgi:two-component system, OmpR family, sensor histidine kinase TctE